MYIHTIYISPQILDNFLASQKKIFHRLLAVNLCVDCSIAGVKRDRSFVFTPKRTETDSVFQELAEMCGRGLQTVCRSKYVAVQHRLITGWEASHSSVDSQ